MEMHTSTVCYVRSLIPVVEAAGLPVDCFCKELGIDREILFNIDARVPKAVVSDAWDIAAAVTQNESLGLLASLSAPLGTFPVLDYIAANLPTVGDALRAITRYCRLCDDELTMGFERVPEGATVRLAFPGKGLRYSRHWAEWFVGLIVSRVRSLGGSPDIHPLAVTFQNPPPAAEADLTMLLGCTPQFRCAKTSVTFGQAVLELRIRDASTFISRIVIRHAESELERQWAGERFTDQMKRSLGDILAHEAPRITTLARKAHCSVRTIQTRLKSEGTSYECVLDGVRHDLALRYVEDPGIRLMEIALLLRFSEASSFYRAFKRWTGTTPLDYRRQLLDRRRPGAGQALSTSIT